MTLAQVELRTQGWYFAFQVVQLFLITTFSSGASTVISKYWKHFLLQGTNLIRTIEQIIDDPTQAPTLLADNLPTASTFYLSFFVLQGITVAASTIFQAGPFIILNILSPFIDTTPRKKFERWTTLSSLSWGGKAFPRKSAKRKLSWSCVDTYPKFTNFAVIGLLLPSHLWRSPNKICWFY